jgi:hypothetical protein
MTPPPHHRLPRPAIIPAGSWPRRMCAELAAGYCGEPTCKDRKPAFGPVGDSLDDIGSRISEERQ